LNPQPLVWSEVTIASAPSWLLTSRTLPGPTSTVQCLSHPSLAYIGDDRCWTSSP
jgi:hypothetical protein